MKSRYDHLSKDELVAQLMKRDSERKLGLVWERDEIEHDRAMNADFVALNLDPELSVGEAPYQNLLIEGDNFDALRYLNIAYRGKVKCICIDPPYNTGNKDFIYNDNFIDRDDSYKHSKWLEYLYRRISLARDLLTDDGVLMVCINDENRSKLELMLDQALPGMRLGSFVWRTRQGSNADQGCFLSLDHEYVLVYGNPGFKFLGYEKSYEMYSNVNDDPKGDWRTGDLTLGFSYIERPNLYYPLRDPKTDIYYPSNPSGVWRYATKDRLKPGQRLQAKTMEEFIELDQIIFPGEDQKVVVWNSREELNDAMARDDVPKSGKAPILRPDLPDLDFWIGKKVGFGRPAFKRYKADLRNLNQPVSSWIVPTPEKKKYEAENSFVSGTNQEGAKAIASIFGVKVFNYAKPPSLMKELVRQSTGKDDLVMDFFGGSGTTAQALLELNQEDKGSRRFIIVSSTEATSDNPLKNICQDVCAKRIKGVIEGYGSVKGTGSNFAYMRTERIPFDNLLLDIGHDQVWYTLQLLHDGSVTPYNDTKPFQISSTGSPSVIYVPELTPVASVAVIAAANQATGPMVIYTWQPGMLNQSIFSEYVCIEQVPEYLTDRFSGGAA